MIVMRDRQGFQKPPNTTLMTTTSIAIHAASAVAIATAPTSVLHPMTQTVGTPMDTAMGIFAQIVTDISIIIIHIL